MHIMFGKISMLRRFVVPLVAAALLVSFVRPVAAQAPEPPRFNIKSPTLGGKQFWYDELVYGQWRIQQNVLTKHFRLLDDKNARRAWGTFEQCKTQLESLRRDGQVPSIKPRVVIALHGLIRSRSSMDDLCDYIEQNGDFSTLNVSYASTRSTLAEHAQNLAHVMRNLDPGIKEINFVAHSLGNLVIRRYLADCYAGVDGLRPDPRIRRIVMLAPPNHGADMAKAFKNNVLMEWIWGASAVQLAEQWDELQKHLATPRCEFGIIAGGKGDEDGRNVLLDGDDDFVLQVEETKLAGATDFAVLPVSHSKIMGDETVHRYALTFFEHGYFVSQEAKRPLAPTWRAER